MYLTLTWSTCPTSVTFMQKECYIQAECDNLRLWWANYLPFEPGTPFVPSTPGTPSQPSTPGTPSVPSLPGLPRDVRWKDGESTTCIPLECLEGKAA